MRLQKYMAKCGIASRRKSEEIIEEGRVKVNGKIISEQGYKVDYREDIITVDDQSIKMEEEDIYIMLNKPVGYTSTLKDKHSENKVIDLIKGVDERIYPVGRLDEDSEGLLLMTNDGDLTYRLTHPSYEVKKEYIVKVKGRPDEESLDTLRKGIYLNGVLTAEAQVNILSERQDNTILSFIIHEGRNRQIRKMCDYIGCPVINLKRVSLGKIELGDLKTGSFRHLSKEEINSLRKEVGLK